jgi:hypothetical protein
MDLHHDSGVSAESGAPRQYLTGPQVCARYGITAMTLHRWLGDAALRFPQPAMRIRDRRFWLEADLIAFERRAVPDRKRAAGAANKAVVA